MYTRSLPQSKPGSCVIRGSGGQERSQPDSTDRVVLIPDKDGGDSPRTSQCELCAQADYCDCVLAGQQMRREKKKERKEDQPSSGSNILKGGGIDPRCRYGVLNYFGNRVGRGSCN